MFTTLETVRAEALFVSDLQPSEQPDGAAVRHAVARALCRFRVRGCAARVAGEFGDHPEDGARRMRWALACVRAAYPCQNADDPTAAAVTGLAVAA